MKKIILFLTIILSVTSFSQKSQFAIYIPIDIPDKAIMSNMNTAAGIGFSFGYRPIFGFPMIAEFKSSFGTYGSENKSSKVYMYEGYSNTTVNQDFRSRFNKYLLGTKWLIGYDFKTVRAFITPQIGLANFRTISSYSYDDPNNQNHSGRKLPQRNLNPVCGLELGTEIVLNDIFKKKITGNTKHRLLLSASFLQGFGNFSYCNVNNMFDVNTLNGGTFEINDQATYVHLPSNEYINETYYTEIYTSKLTTWGMNIGYIINFEPKEE